MIALKSNWQVITTPSKMDIDADLYNVESMDFGQVRMNPARTVTIHDIIMWQHLYMNMFDLKRGYNIKNVAAASKFVCEFVTVHALCGDKDASECYTLCSDLNSFIDAMCPHFADLKVQACENSFECTSKCKR